MEDVRLSPAEEDALYLKNIKDDIILIQFKLMRRGTMKVVNTISFLNLPITKSSDINIATLFEILAKQQKMSGGRPSSSIRGAKNGRENHQFLPVNKSILTRIMFQSLIKMNTLVISHFSKRAIEQHISVEGVSGSYASGTAKGLFNAIFKIGYETKPGLLVKKKMSTQQSQKLLERTFKSELSDIYKEIGEFRDGLKSFEVYTE